MVDKAVLHAAADELEARRLAERAMVSFARHGEMAGARRMRNALKALEGRGYAAEAYREACLSAGLEPSR
jgi:hypothetical protein